MNITIKIDAPELVGAINNLAKAFGSSSIQIPSNSQPVIEDQKVTDKPKEQPKPEPVKEDKPAETETKKEDNPEITAEDVRPVLAEVSKAGLKDKLRDLFYHFGASKFSEVDKKDYPKLLEEAKALL